jgi:PhnB protein
MNPYLSFDGRCEEAFKFYEKCLGGKIAFLKRYGEGPAGGETPPVPPGWEKQVMHATLKLRDGVLQGADAPPGQYQKPQGFSLSLAPRTEADAERLFQALAENGEVQMPLQQTFWALRFGVVTDQFGTPWIINCEEQPA